MENYRVIATRTSQWRHTKRVTERWISIKVAFRAEKQNTWLRERERDERGNND